MIKISFVVNMLILNINIKDKGLCRASIVSLYTKKELLPTSLSKIKSNIEHLKAIV